MGHTFYTFCAVFAAFLFQVDCDITPYVNYDTSSDEEPSVRGGPLDDFCYTDVNCGPDSAAWKGQCHSGKQQSPIKLPKNAPSTVKPEDEGEYLFPPGSTRIHLTYYKATSFMMRNNGHTLQIQLLDDYGSAKNQPIGFSKYQLPNVLEPIDYRLDSMHFHWGSQDNIGSEHILDDGRTRFAMEAHFVLYKDTYPSTIKALQSSDRDALTVIGVWFTVHNNDANPMAPILKYIPQVLTPTSNWLLVNDTINLAPLLPNGTMYHYEGSLTSPYCDEKVDWYVHRTPVQISAGDVDQFRKLKQHNGKPLFDNFRPVQDSTGRNISIAPVSGAF